LAPSGTWTWNSAQDSGSHASAGVWKVDASVSGRLVRFPDRATPGAPAALSIVACMATAWGLGASGRPVVGSLCASMIAR
jgi:hypothetical protein